MDNNCKRRIIVGVSGASGVCLAGKLLSALKSIENIETHLVITDSARITWEYEMNNDINDLISLADYYYDNKNVAANISSGTFKTDGMIILPCSMKTVAGIVSGYSDSLLLRAADVILKEKRKLVLMVRETPLSTIHLRNLHELSSLGAYILPMVLSYYSHPKSIEDMENQLLGKALDCLNIDNSYLKRWTN